MNCLDHTQMLLHMLDSTWHALLQNLFGQMRVLSIPVLFLVSQSKYLYGYESEGQNFQNLIFILVIFKQNKNYTNQKGIEVKNAIEGIDRKELFKNYEEKQTYHQFLHIHFFYLYLWMSPMKQSQHFQ